MYLQVTHIRRQHSFPRHLFICQRRHLFHLHNFFTVISHCYQQMSSPSPSRYSRIKTCLPPTSRRESSIHGSGLFAVERIAIGTRIAEFEGDKLSCSQFHEMRRLQLYEPDEDAVIRVNRNYTIAGDTMTTSAAVVNHSCLPNSMYRTEKVYDFSYNGNKRSWDVVYIIAIREIAPREEITCCYYWTPTEQERLPCNCRSNGCTTVVGLPSRQHSTTLAHYHEWEQQQSRISFVDRVGDIADDER